MEHRKKNLYLQIIIDEFPIADLETIQKVEHQLKTNESYKNSVVRNFVIFYII